MNSSAYAGTRSAALNDQVVVRGAGRAWRGAAAVLSSEGQVTIPLGVRTALGLGAGDRIEFVEAGNGQFTVMAATKSVKSLRGIIPAKRTVSLEEVNEAIAARGAPAR